MVTARCRSCDAPIVWAEHERTGSRMPLDAQPHPEGTWLVQRVGDVVLAYHAPEHNGPLRRSHFATCPNADRHRRAA